MRSRRLIPNRGLTVLTVVLGVSALLEAIDSGVVLLPFPVGPVWVRIALEIAWIAWTTGAVVVAVLTARRPARLSGG